MRALEWFLPVGRIRRRVFWLGYALPMTVVSFVFTVRPAFAELRIVASQAPIAALDPLDLALWALQLWPWYVGTARRLHDVGWSGGWAAAYWEWLLAFPLMPGTAILPAALPLLLGGVALFVVAGLRPGQDGPNRYGPDPRAA